MNAFALPGLRLKGQAGRTRGASLFAWHSGTDTLAASVKRRCAAPPVALHSLARPPAAARCRSHHPTNREDTSPRPPHPPPPPSLPACYSCPPATRVLLFKYDGLEFVEQREVALPDAPACMALAGGTLYVGLAKR